MQYYIIKQIWLKAIIVHEYDPSQVRKDIYGNFIVFDQYGKRGQFGWEVDHIYPESKGGSDNLHNLQPLHWQANRQKSDKIVS